MDMTNFSTRETSNVTNFEVLRMKDKRKILTKGRKDFMIEVVNLPYKTCG